VIGAPGVDVDTDEHRGVAYVLSRDKLADGDPCTGDSECLSGTCTGGICGASPGTGGSSATGGSGGSGASTAGTFGNNSSGGGSGCSCRVDRTTPTPLGWLMLALFAAMRRRRTDSSRHDCRRSASA
jgi:MYXO-CTERM domain-containing protein